MSVKYPPLTKRQRQCLEALVAVHQEFGLFTTITATGLTYLTGEAWAGSLSTLCHYGLVERVNAKQHGISYRMTEAGFAEFAGVEVPA